MTQIHSIVAATDLSAPARHAADRAARLARTTSAALTLVHAVNGSAIDELRRWLGGEDPTERALLDAAHRQLHELASDLAQRYQLTVSDRVSTGHVVGEIARYADELQADLLVTGTRGEDFLRHLMLGSTAERLVRKISRPVLMVRQTPRASYRRVLVPVDFSPWSAASIEMAKRVAGDAHFVLMHAVEVPFEGKLRLAGVAESSIEQYRRQARAEAEQELRELARHAGLAPGAWTMATPDGGDPWVLIVQQEQEQDCDLIVIGKHGRNVLEELLLGSTTKMVIAESTGDVLVSNHAGTAADDTKPPARHD